MKKHLPASEVAGWIGVACILVAYIFLNFDILVATNSIYRTLNIVGAVCLCYDTWKQKDYQPLVLNIIWAMVAAIALIRSF